MTFRELLNHFRNRLDRDRLSAELDEELRFHQSMLERDERGRGATPAEARRRARLTLGFRTHVRERVRDVCSLGWVDDLLQDIRYAIRGLRRDMGFSIAVALTLALGFGANIAMFGIIDRLLFRPPALMHEPKSVHRVYLRQSYRGKPATLGAYDYARYVDLVNTTRSFAQSAAMSEQSLAVGAGNAAHEMPIAVVSASFFSFFNAPPVVGRYFVREEDEPPTGAAVVVLSHALWQTRFGGVSQVLGSKLQIGRTTYTIIGVAPSEFVGLWPNQPPAAFIPITSFASTAGISVPSKWWQDYGASWMSMIVRRKRGVTVSGANADLTAAFGASLRLQRAASPYNLPDSTPAPSAIVGPILADRGPLESNESRLATWLSGVTIFILLIACANVVNLLLARAARRRREIAVRLALGISRSRMFAQLVTESLVLAAAGGIVGVAAAQFSSSALRAVLMPSTEGFTLVRDARTLAFGGGAALLVGLLTGVAPVLQTWHADLTDDLKAGARDRPFRQSRLRRALLVLQAALSAVLLVGAGLLVRSARNAHSVRLGYDVDPVALVSLNMRDVTLDSARTLQLRQRLVNAARTIPGVQHATLQSAIPFSSTWSIGLFVDGDTVSRTAPFSFNAVTPEYFATLGTRIIRGRGFSPAVGTLTRREVVVSESMAKRLWPDQDAIGQCIKVKEANAPCTYVVGIAEDIKARSLSEQSGLYYYLPVTQFDPTRGGLFVRVSGSASHFAEALERGLRREMPGAAYVHVTPLGDIVGSARRAWTVGAAMFMAMGALALALAAVGLYGVVAYMVAQRTHELGVRIALGARVPHVLRLVIVDGVSSAVLGAVIGMALVLLVGQFVRPVLFEESPRDPLVLGTVLAMVLAAATAASWIPAWRVARLDPQAALRTD